MRIAVFDYQLNNGGGKRFLINLLIAFADLDKNLSLTFFYNPNIPLDSASSNKFQQKGINTIPFKSIKKPALRKTFVERAFNYAVNKAKIVFTKPKDFDTKLAEEMTEISKDFDLAYFPWPYLMKSPKTYCPKIATFHDFNFKYFFGTHIYNQNQIRFLNETFEVWMTDTVPVVSTYFMQQELLSFYSNLTDAHVIHLPSLNPFQYNKLDRNQNFEHSELLNLPYIVFPVHLTSHKNIGNVIAAISLINCDEIKTKLVLTGGNTEIIQGRSGYYGLKETSTNNTDVIGLGYISDEQMHHLLKNSFAVINASFYEAGNGVGLDAWAMGIPVIQSNIPAFEEHIFLQGFSAFTFDPRDAKDIARAILKCFNDHEKRKSNVENSLKKSRSLSWNSTAQQYYDLFKKTVQR